MPSAWRFLRLILLAVGASALLLYVLRSTGPGRAGLAVGEPAPPIQAEGWLNGEPVTSASLAGKVVVVDAWASWCGPCRAATPELIEVYKRYQGQGVVFVGLTAETGDELKDVEEFLTEAKVPWVTGYGARATFEGFQVRFIPAIFVIGTDGKVVWNKTTSGNVVDGIEAALGRRA